LKGGPEPARGSLSDHRFDPVGAKGFIDLTSQDLTNSTFFFERFKETENFAKTPQVFLSGKDFIF